MNQRESEEIEFERETSKIGLDLFVQNLKKNSFSKAVFEQTEKLQKELNDTIFLYRNDQQKSDQNEYYYHLDTEFLEDKLSALSEMNIVYAFKDFEINIKKLLGAAYGIDTHEFYRKVQFAKNMNDLKGFLSISQKCSNKYFYFTVRFTF